MVRKVGADEGSAGADLGLRTTDHIDPPVFKVNSWR
jgi:hypothetical protein